MKLAEEITISIAGEDVELRPTLRLALQWERRPGGFSRVLRDLDDLSLSTAADLIADHDPHPLIINRVFDAGLVNLREPLVRYVLALAGVDPENVEKAATSKGKTVPLATHLTELYRLATGWLGWTPDVALDATPTEIMEAFKGREAMLQAIFGTGGKGKAKDPRPLDQKVRDLFAGRARREPAA